ncbi:MAG: hypothetical protein ACKOKF_06445 [Bacteroidota bacterium]
MKRILLSIALSGSIFFFDACRSGGSAREVSEQFLEYIGNNEYDKAKDISTEETGRLLDMMEAFDRMSEEGTVKERKFKILELKTEGSSSKVTYVETGKENIRREFMLIKRDGQWLVSADKSMLSGTPDGTLNIGGTTTQPE